MQITTNLTVVTVLALATNSFAGFITEPSPVTITTSQRFLTEERATSSPTHFPSPVSINSEFDGDWSPPSTDQSDAEAGYTTLAVMFTIYPSQYTASESTTNSSATTGTATGARTSVTNSGGVRLDARVALCVILFASLGGLFPF